MANSDLIEEEEKLHQKKSSDQLDSTYDPTVDPAELLGRTKQGLSDPRVNHVRDRGNTFYHRDHAKTGPSSARIRLPEAEANARDAIVADLDRCSLTADHPHAFFVPRDDIERIMLPARVREVVNNSLPGCGDWRAAQRERFTKEILCGGGSLCKNRCINLLAAVIGAEAERYFLPLVECHVDDLCLPLDIEYSYSKQNCFIKCATKHNHDSIRMARARDCRNICLWTYALSSPCFQVKEGQHCHYYLNSKDVLPIQSVDQPPTGIPKVQQHLRDELQPSIAEGFGGFAKVRMVQFHPAHLIIEISKVHPPQNPTRHEDPNMQ